MHERERHQIILSTVQDRPVASVQELVALTQASEATIRRDIAALHVAGKIRRVRGGAEALNPPSVHRLAGRPFSVNEAIHIEAKRAIAKAAVAMCRDDEAIIINGGTTTFQMVRYLARRRLDVLTNSFPIAEHLVRNSRCTVTMPGGTVYREQNIVLSPFESDVIRNFCAGKLFMGAQGVGTQGALESDPLIVQAETKLIGQADEIVLLVDSSKFAQRCSMVSCPLERIATIITDDGIDERAREMLDAAGVELVLATRPHKASQAASAA